MQNPILTMARGLDASYAQAAIDWQAVKAAGITFAVARATYGASVRDNTFAHNWPGMRAAGLLRSAYHFALPGQTSPIPRDDASRQAQAFVAAIRAAGGYDADLPTVLDLEQNPANLAPAALNDWAVIFCEVTDGLLGVSGPRATMIYSGLSFLTDNIPANSPLKARGLWLAWPSGGPVPNLPAWDHWTVLQTSWRGREPGIVGPVDTDVWALTAQELSALYGPHLPVARGPRIVLWQHPIFQADAEALAAQYGWLATSDMATVATASAVVCIGGTPEWIAQAKATCRGVWHDPLAGQTLWRTLALLAQAGITGRF